MYRQLTKPRPWGLADTPEGSPIFQQGWEDGCETGMRVYGGLTYRMAYQFKQDQELVNDPEYYTAWRDAYTYCRWYVWNWVRPTRQ